MSRSISQPISLKLMREFEPKSKWLLHDSHLHGVGHMMRVFILQELICDELIAKGITVNREATRWAAMAHDVGRVDDGIDREHGFRSAKWIKENFSSIMAPNLLDTVTYIVHWHVPSDEEAPVMTTELQVLKDADALDRVRLNDLDPRYLRIEVSKSLIGIAEDLYQSYLKCQLDDIYGSVIRAGQDIGIIERGAK